MISTKETSGSLWYNGGFCYLDVLTTHACGDPFLEWFKPRQDDSTWLTSGIHTYVVKQSRTGVATYVHTSVDKRNKRRSRPVHILDWFTPAICCWSWNDIHQILHSYIVCYTEYTLCVTGFVKRRSCTQMHTWFCNFEAA